jgi:hypothetical protein
MSYVRRFLAMSLEEAKVKLGFPPGSTPSDNEVNKAYRAKIIQNKQVHPDLGGDQTELVELNVAKDTLLGQLTPERTYERPTPGGGGGGGARWSPPPKQEITFEEAKSRASVPTGVIWMFVTEPARSGYSSDESMRQATGYVYYGQTEQKHVFVVVEHLQKEDYYIGGGPGIDTWSIRDFSYPKQEGEVLQPAWLYGNVVKGFKMFKYVEKRFNSMVVDLPPDWHLHERIPNTKETSIKHWLVNKGVLPEDDPSVVNRKNVVELTVESRGSSYSFSQHSIQEGRPKEPPVLVLTINGKNYKLSERDASKFYETWPRPVLDEIFGDYYYDGSKKTLSKLAPARRKKIFGWLSKNMSDLPDPAKKVIDLEAAK